MADDLEKTEQPTPKKLRDAHQRGDVVTSKEVTTWFYLIGFLTFVWLIMPYEMQEFANLGRSILENIHNIEIDEIGFGTFMWQVLMNIFKFLMVPLALFVVIAIVSNFIQHGFVFTTKPIMPKLSKLSLGKGFKKMFSMQSIAEFGKGLIKMIIVASIAYSVYISQFRDITSFLDREIIATLYVIWQKVIVFLSVIVGIFAAIAMLDYMYQQYLHTKKLRMTKEEVKDEFKQSMGNPEVKSKIRNIRVARARERMMAKVPEADVVITNPTHYAVALQYNPDTMDAPVIIAKGADHIAQQIKEIAKDSDIPRIENKPLARALFVFEIDQPVPPEHYKAVAEIISYVWSLKGKRV